jgi:outer membrane protein OmpA-like peptidoglycan-associated protein
MTIRTIFFFLVGHFCPPSVWAQKTTPPIIELQNPSFEGDNKNSQPPRYWHDVDAFNETPPDTQPFSFGVTKAAQEGKTYLGLVVRDNDTYEAVWQALKSPLLQGETYLFNLWACRAAKYQSKSRLTMRDDDYNIPAVLELWAKKEMADAPQKLGATPPLSNLDWQQFFFEFTPATDLNYFFIKAYYAQLPAYTGNILVDNLSPFVPKKGITTDVKPSKPNKLAAKKKNTVQPAMVTAPAFTPKLLSIPFAFDSAELPASAHTDLDEYAQILKTNPQLKAYIEGYVNQKIDSKEEASRLAQKRAEAVRDYWVKKGIKMGRLTAVGVGKADRQGVKITLSE